MALALSLIVLLSLLCVLGTAKPYLDFTLGLSRNVGTSGGARIRGDRSNELSLTRPNPRLGSLSNRIQEGDELLDVVLLATIDGKFHALNRTDGTILWSMHNSFTTDCAVGDEKSLSPLIRTPHVLQSLSPGEGGEDEEDEKIYIVEPQSGSIYVLPPHATHSTPISKLSLTVPQLVDMAPAAFPGEETRMFVGRKETSLIAIDLDTGVVKGIVDTDRECLWEPVLGGQGETGADLDDLEDTPQSRRKREVYVGRTDYTVQIRSSRSAGGRKRRKKSKTQTLLYSSYGPNTIHKGIQSTYTDSLDGLYVQSLPGGEVIAFDVSDRSGSRHGKEEKKTLRWGNRLDEPVVATFDVLYPSKNNHSPDVDPESTNPYILLQPVPDLSRVFHGYPATGNRDSLGYVGVVKDSLYVLSSEGYPLAAFSDPLHQSSSDKEGHPLLEGDSTRDKNSQNEPASGPQTIEFLHPHEAEDSDDTCTTLECIKGLRKWENSTMSGTGKVLEMGGSVLSEPNDSDQHHQEYPMLDGGEISEEILSMVARSQLWWAKVFATIGAILAGLALAVLFGVRRIPLLDIVTTNRPVRDSSGWHTIPLPEIVVSPPPGERLEGTSGLDTAIVDKSLPPLPENVHLEPARVQEPIRVDVEGPEGGRISEPELAVVTIPTISQPDQPGSEAVDRDWELTSPPPEQLPSDQPPETVVVSSTETHVATTDTPTPIDLTASSTEPTPPSTDSEALFSDSKPKINNVDLEDEQHLSQPNGEYQAPTNDSLSSIIPMQMPPSTEQTPEINPEEDADPEAEVEVDTVQQENKKKKNRTRSRAKKKKAAFAREVEEREKEKEREKLEKEKRTADRVIEKVVMEIEAEKRVEPVKPVSSLVVSEEVLGFGSHGTMVFKGAFQGRAVAVKRLLNDFVTLASREVTLLQESDAHPNVIRYYFQEARYNFLYIALELCPASLADIVERPDNPAYTEISCNFDPKKALSQISSGLRWLHGLKIVHRDIKPQNILIAQPQPNRNSKGVNYRMLISDFGLCKKLGADETSFLPTVHGAMAAGTVGWRAPEILRGEVKIDDSSLSGNSDETSQSSRGSTGTLMGGSTSSANRTRLTKSVDIFALGCLFYYTLTSGGHPFGDRYEREGNILKSARDLSGLEAFGEEGIEAIDLIGKMVADASPARPDTTTILLHPFFWNPARRLTFLQDASDRFEIMCREPRETPLLMLETGASSVVGTDWHSRLDRTFIDNLGKFRKYQGGSVQDLMRALRNKKHHYQDLPDNVKRNLGPLPDGFLAYFTRRFPRLFLHVYYVVSACGLSQESMFKSYFDLQET